MSDTRYLAVTALLEIFTEDVRPKQSLDAQAHSLDRRDRSFLMEIVYGVLRYRATLDWILKDFLRNPERLGASTLNNLRAAVYQIFFMRVTDWAVVNEAVEVEKTLSRERIPGKPSLVNAVLRNVMRQKERYVFPLAFSDPVMNITMNTSHPMWLVKRWIKRFGPEEALRLAEANNRIPRLTLRTNTLRTTRDELLDMLNNNGMDAAPTTFSPDGVTLKEAGSFEDLSFIRGLFAVQDEASQLVSYLLGPKPGERILDACAAPGGKTTHIAQLMNDEGKIIAVEKDGRRIPRLKENIEQLGIRSAEIVHADIVDMKNTDGFDRILLDAPCSATGVIRRNPDVKYRHKAADLAEFRSKQSAMLVTVSKRLKDNGTLVYSVCSTEPEEGEQVVDDFLKTMPDFSIIDAEVPFLKDIVQDGFFRTFPHKHNMDGFFGVQLCRKK